MTSPVPSRPSDGQKALAPPALQGSRPDTRPDVYGASPPPRERRGHLARLGLAPHIASLISSAILCSLMVIGCGESPAEDKPPKEIEMAAPTPDQGAVTDMGAAEVDQAPPEDQALPPDAAPLELPCNDAVGSAPEGVTLRELAWDDGAGVATVVGQSWAIEGTPLDAQRLFEVVRFELDRPARIHRISVQYGVLPRFADAPLKIGVYPDFGYNGFDFWAAAPHWEGSRCRGDAEEGRWLHFTPPEPIEIEAPGLVFIGHERSFPDDPALLFDGSQPEGCADGDENCCAPFAACHSAWNFPEIKNLAGTPFWAGFSTTFRYDYLVRAEVEYLTEPAAPRFVPVEGVELGSRSAWGDYDNDGDPDLLTSGPRLYRNEGGRFEEVTEEVGLSALGVQGDGIWGDYDNDGCLDLFVFAEATGRGEALLRGLCDGEGGSEGFEDQSAVAGLSDLSSGPPCGEPEEAHAPTPAAAWADLDGDGLLDLYLANFICWSLGHSYGDQVWHNEGDGRFSDWSDREGFNHSAARPLASRGVSPVDYELDGDIDLFVNSYRLHPNRFYQNQGPEAPEGERFREVAAPLGLAGRPTALGLNEAYGHSIGVAWGDLNGDQRFDAVVGNLAHPRFFDFSNKSEVLLQQEDGAFVDLQGDSLQGPGGAPAGGAGLRYQETHSVPLLGDFDLDGHLDLALSAVYDGRPTELYWGEGDGRFRLDGSAGGLTVDNGWGMSAADFDGDGDLDIAAKGQLFRNEGERRGHWLSVALIGDASNRSALGATVILSAGERRWIRSVDGGSGQGGQGDATLHFGLGEVEEIDDIEVIFIGVGRRHYPGPHPVDQRLLLEERGGESP